jgi:hypothetical protein
MVGPMNLSAVCTLKTQMKYGRVIATIQSLYRYLRGNLVKEISLVALPFTTTSPHRLVTSWGASLVMDSSWRDLSK